MIKKQKALLLGCPNCGETEELLLVEEQSFYANTQELFCTSVKMYDHDAKAKCLQCGWRGVREDLVERGEK